MGRTCLAKHYFFGRASVLSRESKSLVASAFGMARDSEYFRRALAVIGPKIPSAGPGPKPRALSMLCNSRISSLVSGTELAGVINGICEVDNSRGSSGADLANSCGIGGAGAGESRGGEIGGTSFSSILSARVVAAFACSIRFEGIVSEG